MYVYYTIRILHTGSLKFIDDIPLRVQVRCFDCERKDLQMKRPHLSYGIRVHLC